MSSVAKSVLDEDVNLVRGYDCINNGRVDVFLTYFPKMELAYQIKSTSVCVSPTNNFRTAW
jgi:hypothetical protein